MNLAHKKDDSIAELLVLGKVAEAEGAWADAERLYRRVLRKQGSHLRAFQRLMIICRKQKQYSEELAVIRQAIAAYSSLYEPKASHNTKVRSLSARINKAFGMVDSKGRSKYEPDPVAVWKKRKELVEKRLAKQRD